MSCCLRDPYGATPVRQDYLLEVLQGSRLHRRLPDASQHPQPHLLPALTFLVDNYFFTYLLIDFIRLTDSICSSSITCSYFSLSPTSTEVLRLAHLIPAAASASLFMFPFLLIFL